ncbi:hypothetical protein J437_LFUL000162, partial [Ladona fulva]
MNGEQSSLLFCLRSVTRKCLKTTEAQAYSEKPYEQQGFRSGRSRTDAVFVVRQIEEKSIEYNKPAYTFFIGLEKAFD